ncbi:hypothetical protein [Carboxylicivirga linearis]|uniref:Preprotein translocase subunit SecD n=1 Tax=Carboxylicivirga linearis TaxID=1628157 RepID=A0ABS5JWG0_9BACT|nr:hypothetical protein [Carboxylicivirga linearis]MBS2099188.1 hypothetical protein [Carboxylicivirga linearis]
MKNTYRILVSLAALIIITISAHAVTHIEFETAIQFVKENGAIMAAAPVLVSPNITKELIDQLKVKHGKLKIITVVVEAPVYDIDQLTSVQTANLRILGIDPEIVSNSELPIEDRLKQLERLKEFRDDSSKLELLQTLTCLEGKILEDGEQYQFLVKRPDRGLIKMLLPLAQSGKIDDFAEKGVKNLVVGGDMEALDDGIVFMGVVSQLKQMIAPAQAFLSKA